MANPEHLHILKQGVKAWNEWKSGLPRPGTSIEFDLIGADLSGASLQNIDFFAVNLTGADLSDANLSHSKLDAAILDNATLTDADLGWSRILDADLKEADLRRSTLMYADFSGCDLRGARLEETDLGGAILNGADLEGAALAGARLVETLLFKTNLTQVTGLDRVYHEAASILDHTTIARSGPLPISFLRGCGLPDLIIDNVEVIRSDPLQFYSCFISHSSEDADFAQRLYADLQDEGIRCWFAPEDMRGGRKTYHQINEAIRVHDKLVLILSEASMNSNWVEHEIRQARKRERQEDRQVLFPIRLVPFDDVRDWTLFDADEGRNLAAEIREYHIPGFTEWKNHEAYKMEFDRLVHDLRAED